MSHRKLSYQTLLWKVPEALTQMYFALVYTKTVDSVFQVLWYLATETQDIQCYSLIHLQAPSDAKLP